MDTTQPSAHQDYKRTKHDQSAIPSLWMILVSNIPTITINKGDIEDLFKAIKDKYSLKID